MATRRNGERRKAGVTWVLPGLAVALLATLLAVTTGTAAAQQKPEEIPDAPSATRPIPPPEAPSPRPGANDTSDQDIPLAPPATTESSSAPGTRGSGEMPRSAP